jgi:hypothetical protein
MRFLWEHFPNTLLAQKINAYETINIYNEDTDEWIEKTTRVQPYALLEQGNGEWHSGREKFDVTASQAGSFLGYGFESANKTILQKAGKIQKEFTEFSLAAMKHGTDTEPEAKEAFLNTFKENYGLADDEAFMIELGLWIYMDDHRFAGSPDAVLVWKNKHTGEWMISLVENKCPFYKNYHKIVDIQYLVQVQFLMTILGLPSCHLVYYYKDKSMKIFYIHSNDSFWNVIYDKLLERIKLIETIKEASEETKFKIYKIKDIKYFSDSLAYGEPQNYNNCQVVNTRWNHNFYI